MTPADARGRNTQHGCISSSCFHLVGPVIVSALGAFALVKHKPPGSKTLFNIVIAAPMSSPHVTTIPRYLVVNLLKLMNTSWAHILPRIAVAYNFFLMKQFAEQIPEQTRAQKAPI